MIDMADAGLMPCLHVKLTLSPPIPLRHYTLPYWSNPPFLISDILVLWRQSARMSEIKNDGLDQYGAEPFFEQQQFGIAGIEGVKSFRNYYFSLR